MNKEKTTLNTGLVISHLGKALSVESESGNIVVCHTRRRLEYPAVGDRVLWEACGDNQGWVKEILPRNSLISRPRTKGRNRPVAANISQLLIVICIEPECDFLLIDQFLVVCEQLNIDAYFLLNKIDLPNQKKFSALLKKLEVYKQLDYPIIQCSARTGSGFDQLKGILKNSTSMLIGQSGVGKSSISKTLIPSWDFRTQPLSLGTGKGTHTTTRSTLYHLPDGGDLIDSPGVAIFGLADISEKALAFGYREFQSYLDDCRFNNCKHIKDKGCRINAAVEDGDIDSQRYSRYLKLHKKLLVQ